MRRDVPIAQVREGDGLPGHGAADEITLLEDFVIGVEIADPGFPPRRLCRVTEAHGRQTRASAGEFEAARILNFAGPSCIAAAP